MTIEQKLEKTFKKMFDILPEDKPDIIIVDNETYEDLKVQGWIQEQMNRMLATYDMRRYVFVKTLRENGLTAWQDFVYLKAVWDN